jgi:hypothetical protein
MPDEPSAPAAATVPAPTPAEPIAPTTPSAPSAPESFDRSYVEKLRQEAAGHRTKHQAAEKRIQDILKAAGIETPGDAPAPEAVQAQFGKLQAQIKDLKISGALSEQFVKHGVKPVLAKAMLQSQGILTDLDPDDAEFTKTLSGAIKKMADDYPELKAVQVTATPTRSGSEFKGSGQQPTVQLTREQLKGMTPEAIMKARADGQLDELTKPR